MDKININPLQHVEVFLDGENSVVHEDVVVELHGFSVGYGEEIAA